MSTLSSTEIVFETPEPIKLDHLGDLVAETTIDWKRVLRICAEETKSEFRVWVKRPNYLGEMSESQITIGALVPGDEPYALAPPFNSGIHSIIDVEAAEIPRCQPLDDIDTYEKSVVYVCTGVAFLPVVSNSFDDGIKWISPKALSELFRMRLPRLRTPFGSSHPNLLYAPGATSGGPTGALVMRDDVGPAQHRALNQVAGRLMALAFLEAGVNGRIISSFHFGPDQSGWSIRSDVYQGGHELARLPSEITLREASGPLKCCIAFIRDAADYRTRALEVFQQSGGVNDPAIRFLLLWIALEGLVSEREGVRLNLALSLCAFFDVPSRESNFSRLMRLYAERSNIVHGFKVSDEFDYRSEILYLTELLKSTIVSSSSFAKRTALVAHLRSRVLSQAL
jgi:hypothetical protein